MDNYLAAEPLLIERIKTEISGFRQHVFSAEDLAGVEEQSQVTPAAHVIYLGDRLGGSAGSGALQGVIQEWMVVVVVRNVRDQKGGAAARATAGPLILQTLRALSGWQPSPEFDALRRIPGPRPMFRPGGFVYFPLAFETRLFTGA